LEKLVIGGGDGRPQTARQFIAKVAVSQFLPLMLELENIQSLQMSFKSYYNRTSTIKIEIVCAEKS